MITDARALQEDYIPHDLRHREGQIDALASSLKPIARGLSGEDVFIFGPSGSGKTTLAKYVADQLEQETLTLRRGYVNCISDPTPTAVLSTLVRDANLGARRPDGTPRSYYLDLLREADDQILAIIDECNVLDDFSLLRALYAIDGVTIVAISISEDDLFSAADLQSQTRSRLRSFGTLRLSAYSHAQMVDILEYRVDHGLDRDRITDEAIDYIADLAAGNARDGIAVLRRAARRAAADGLAIDRDLVKTVRGDARADVRQQRVRSLGTHQRTLYNIIQAHDEIPAGTLHDEYERRIQEPRSRRRRREYLNALEQYSLIVSDGDGRWTTYMTTERAD
ncbi:Cdc6/Cdc18 family protein [Salinirussus salinus]|jgi:Cdc6-like AAA superfamily ATPase|uniref:Cdc6/Cdc18 family protein n=1 Tax=Salinirussus salinus TaxID=1198300 RepID=UPI00135CD032|nr:Cdc6/Cdc18 family protein [Salinirussus salinus]